MQIPDFNSIPEDVNYSEAQLSRSYNSYYNRIIKRGCDFFIALSILIVLLPCYVLLAVFVACETGFPVFYRPERGGYKMKNFRIFKFRSMVKDADKIGGGTTALNDKRITRVGAFLRKTKLDEIPQLFNVLNGSMSLIGPRPELLKYTNDYKGIYKNILNVRPGITDFSSICFINLDEIVGTENVDEMYEKYVLKKKNVLRLKYVAEISFMTDVKLFWHTVHKVIKKSFSLLFSRD